jgi:4-hydroxybenzoate polyprenyltransferase
MVLNDVHDIEQDKAQRRNGPLVDGRIRLRSASIAGWGLLTCGLSLALAARFFVPDSMVDSAKNSHFTWLIAPVGLALALSIVAYDSKLKSTHLGPWIMGLCRGLNIMLGVALGTAIAWPTERSWTCILSAIAGHMLFVVGITLAARREGLMKQSSMRMAAAWFTSVVGIGGIATSSLWGSGLFWQDATEFRLDPFSLFPLLVGLLALPWLRRAMLSITNPGIGTLVPAIKQAILTIIFLDAAIALQFGGNVTGLIVCSFAIPTLALSRVFRMT